MSLNRFEESLLSKNWMSGPLFFNSFSVLFELCFEFYSLFYQKKYSGKAKARERVPLSFTNYLFDHWYKFKTLFLSQCLQLRLPFPLRPQTF